ncbi:MAG: M17 family metallopeptidase, partial [Pseudomonadota bacterium]
MNFTPPPLRLRTGVLDRKLSSAALSELDHVVVVLGATFKPKSLASVPFGNTVKTLRDQARSKTGLMQGIVQSKRQVGLTVVTLPKVGGAFEFNTLARRVLSAALRANPARIGVHIEADDEARQFIAVALTRAALAACAPLPHYKSRRGPKPKLRALTFYGAVKLDFTRLKIEAEANHLARWITAQPPNMLDANALVKGALGVASTIGCDAQVYDELALNRLGAGAFLAVARANAHSDAAIVHLERRGPGKRIALVGKGVCYDTGGINVKPANYMNGMHEDMEGSAVALASFLAMTRLDPDAHLDCWLAVTENRINSHAYTPNEVVTAIDGTSIEVIHSDAEGRMALADTLILVSRNKPDLIIDYATLTGACVAALTTAYTGVFTN